MAGSERKEHEFLQKAGHALFSLLGGVALTCLQGVDLLLRSVVGEEGVVPSPPPSGGIRLLRPSISQTGPGTPMSPIAEGDEAPMVDEVGLCTGANLVKDDLLALRAELEQSKESTAALQRQLATSREESQSLQEHLTCAEGELHRCRVYAVDARAEADDLEQKFAIAEKALHEHDKEHEQELLEALQQVNHLKNGLLGAAAEAAEEATAKMWNEAAAAKMEASVLREQLVSAQEQLVAAAACKREMELLHEQMACSIEVYQKEAGSLGDQLLKARAKLQQVKISRSEAMQETGQQALDMDAESDGSADTKLCSPGRPSAASIVLPRPVVTGFSVPSYASHASCIDPSVTALEKPASFQWHLSPRRLLSDSTLQHAERDGVGFVQNSPIMTPQGSLSLSPSPLKTDCVLSLSASPTSPVAEEDGNAPIFLSSHELSRAPAPLADVQPDMLRGRSGSTVSASDAALTLPMLGGPKLSDGKSHSKSPRRTVAEPQPEPNGDYWETW